MLSLHLLLCCLLLLNCCTWSEIILTCSERQRSKSCTINNYISSENPEIIFPVQDVIYLTFSASQMSSAPDGIFERLSSLKNVSFSYCGIENISQNSFFSHSLLQLDLSHNQLSAVNNSVFKYAPNLNSIDLSYNRIREIDKHAFQNLKKLVEINLSHNQLKILSNPIFVHTKHIKKIDLSGNMIVSIECQNLFKNLSLTELKLNNNNLVSLNETIFQSVRFIKSVELNSNRLVNVSFANLQNIEQISVNENQLEFLKVNNFLRVLHADHNKLNCSNLQIMNDSRLNVLSLLNNSFNSFSCVEMLTELVSLDLSENSLHRTANPNNLIFQNLSKLNVLKLRSCDLNSNEFYIISSLYALEVLDISYNNLNSIDFNSLPENLQKLYINGNQLRNQTFEELEYLLPNLNTLNISDNAWRCNDLVQVLKLVKQLKIKIEREPNPQTFNYSNVRGIRCEKYSAKEIPTESSINLCQVDPTVHAKYINYKDLLNFTAELKASRTRIEETQKPMANHLTDFIPITILILNLIISMFIICYLVYKTSWRQQYEASTPLMENSS